MATETPSQPWWLESPAGAAEAGAAARESCSSVRGATSTGGMAGSAEATKVPVAEIASLLLSRLKA